MEKVHGFGEQDDGSGQMDLPPGFRFHPTDEELITQYLHKKVVDAGFTARAIVDVDLNKSEPWELPWKAKLGEKEWYFFCVRDRKYPTGLRTNRATDAGYWKATGKDKEIYSGKSLVGMKKTLVFYRGRAPKGQKTNWIMHEYRLEGRLSLHNLPKSPKSEWVISRVFQKSYGGKKAQFPELLTGANYIRNGMIHSLPPLMDPSPNDSKPKPAPAVAETPATAYVPCFSNNSPLFCFYADSNCNNSVGGLPKVPPYQPQFSYPGPGLLQENSVLRAMLESNNGMHTNVNRYTSTNMSMGRNFGTQRDQVVNAEISSVMTGFDVIGREIAGAGQVPSTSAGPADLEFIWNN